MKTLRNPTMMTEVLDRIRRVQPGAKPLWGRMSAHAMVCHLSDSFRLALGEKSASEATGMFQRTVMKWGALYVPLRWPKGVPTRPEMEQGRGGTPPADFVRDRAVLEETIQRFSAPDLRFDGVKHPLFGPLKEGEWLRWGYLHADHHLRQFGV